MITMEFGSILILMAILLPVVAYVGQPLFAGAGTLVSKREQRLSRLEAERDRVLATLQEMDMDYSLGKIAQEDYDMERPGLLAQGASAMKEIDALVGTAASSRPPAADKTDRSLEAELEARIAQMRQLQDEGGGQFCPQCGAKVLASDSFCSACGADVAGGEKSS
jgi:hypothetical protein